MAALSPAETCRKVADIIDYETDRFDMGFWETTSDCGTTACIAGHTALLHNDGMNQHPSFWVQNSYGTATSLCPPNREWETRQGRRLGLDEEAAEEMFRSLSDLWMRHNEHEMNWRYSRMLRHLEKELEDREEGNLIDLADLEQIAEEALR